MGEGGGEGRGGGCEGVNGMCGGGPVWVRVYVFLTQGICVKGGVEG